MLDLVPTSLSMLAIIFAYLYIRISICVRLNHYVLPPPFSLFAPAIPLAPRSRRYCFATRIARALKRPVPVPIPNRINPEALDVLEKAGVSTGGLYSKSLETLADRRVEVVITLCDKAAKRANCWQTLLRRWLGTLKILRPVAIPKPSNISCKRFTNALSYLSW